MSISQRHDGRWLVKYKDDIGQWRQKSFRDEEQARAFETSLIEEDAHPVTMGELVAMYPLMATCVPSSVLR